MTAGKEAARHAPDQSPRIRGDWIAAPGLQRVLGVLQAGGQRALLVGGCVRNDLMGVPITDIDIATDAPPPRVTELAAAAGLRALPTGIAHGTVTLRAGGRSYEITTFRRDEATTGRHATVAFSTDIAEDAARRDFTVNALYAEPGGRVLDPLGEGLADLAARRIRFVGRPQDRIREDYLRILRFFRFSAWYADSDEGFEAEALAACAGEAEGIARLSRERIGAEMRRLLAAPDPAPALAAMETGGILARVLPGASAGAVAPLVHLEGAAGLSPDWLRRLAALGGTAPEERLRLSRAEARRHAALRRAATGSEAAAELGYRMGAADALDAALIRAALMGASLPEGLAAACARGAEARFPVAAADLAGAFTGAALGRRLRALEAAWIASDFTLDREALLAVP